MSSEHPQGLSATMTSPRPDPPLATPRGRGVTTTGPPRLGVTHVDVVTICEA
jgi:hypothetical protein